MANQRRSLYKIPPGCTCQGDGLYGTKCSAMVHATLKPLHEVAYDSYCEATDYKSAVTGDPLPEFDQTNEKVQTAWMRSTRRVIEEYERRDRII